MIKKIKKEKIIWWILKKSGIFRYWYEKFLNELMYDLELHRDIEQKEIEAKYKKKLLDFRKNKNFR